MSNLLVLIVGVIYFTPTIVALIKNKNKKLTIIITNIVLGWTLIFWIVALTMCFDSDNSIEVGEYIDEGGLNADLHDEDYRKGFWINRYTLNIINWYK